LLAELETFCTSILSCLPGLRVLVRSQRGEEAGGNVVVVDMKEKGNRFLDQLVMEGPKCWSCGLEGSCAAMLRWASVV
jgi:hypothetical protein